MFREQLMTALKEAVGKYNSGMSDDEAVVKSAEEHSFNPDQTQRLLEVYNTTKTICFFKTAEDRTVEFTTADPENVMGTLFSQERLSEERKAAAANPGSFIPDYSEYDRPESDLWSKAAEDLTITPLKSGEIFDRDMDAIARSAYTLINSVKQSADHCNSTAGMCSTKYQLTMNKLASKLCEDYHNSNKFSEALTFFKAAHGEQADAVIGDLLACLPDVYKEKKATDELVSQFDQFNPVEADLFKQAVDLKLEYAEMKSCAAQFTKMAEEYEQEFKEAAQLQPKEEDDFFAPGLQEKLAKSTYESISTWDQLTGKENPRTTKVEAINPIGSVFGMATDAMGDVAKNEVSSTMTSALAAPKEQKQQKLTDRMRNFQRQLMLEDLITTDPVLQGVDPQLVANAYGTILKLAPEMSLNKEVVRSVLRASTNAEATSPFDAKVLAELESEISKQVKPMKPQQPR